MQAQTIEPLTPSEIDLAAGGTTQLLNVSGPGNVAMIQLAMVATGGTSADRNDATINATIQICTNGEAAPCQHADIGTFFLVHGIPAPPLTFSDNFTVTYYGDGSFGAFRRIMIPYTSGCTISVINRSNVATAKIYSQVYYYAGAPGPQITGTRKKTFHMATIPFTTIAQYAPVDLLNITGRGQIEGVNFFAYQGGGGPPTWLEGNVNWAADGAQSSYAGGTEDFFGGQYYWSQNQYSTDSWGIVKNSTFLGGALYATGMYRLFNKDPLVFDSSFKMTWHNGQVNQANPPGPVNMSTIVFYYLDQ
jgi:hypothetical protein